MQNLCGRHDNVVMYCLTLKGPNGTIYSLLEFQTRHCLLCMYVILYEYSSAPYS